MSSETSSRRHSRRQSDYSAFRCGFAMPLPDFTTTLTVTYKGGMVARTADLERGEVAEELHRLRSLFPFGDGYDVTATVKERTAHE